MFRRIMGAFVALVLVATLLLPLASVGAQEDEIDPGPAPVTTEETIPESAPPPAVEEPPIIEPQPELPVEEAPAIEEPVAEAPAIDDPVVDEPSVEEPVVDTPAVEEPNTETPNDEPVEVENQPEVDEVEAAAAGTTISSMSLDCTGLLSYTIAETDGGALTIWLYGIAAEGNTDLGEQIVSSPSPGAAQVQFSIAPESLTYSIGASIVDANYDLIGVITTSECTDGNPEEPEPDPEPVLSSVVSGVSVTCDGSVTFTISEAHGDVLSIDLTDPYAPSGQNNHAYGEFEASAPGTFTVDFALAEQRDTVRASIWNSSNSWTALATDCLTEEWETDGVVSGMTVSCDGVVSFTVVEDMALAAGLQLYGSNGGSWQSIDSTSLGVVVSGDRAHQFEIPADTWDSLRAEVTRQWSLWGVAQVTGCLENDEEPDPDPVDASVTNLRLFCNGLVRFDLPSENPVTLDIDLATIAPTPEFTRNAQVTGGTGSYQHQFGVPAGWYNDFAVSISTGGTELAGTSIYGCVEGGLNTPPGNEVLAFTRYGMVIFEQVSAEGDTVIDRYWEPNPPALPEGFDPSDALYFALSTTSAHTGAIEVCLNLGQPFIENSDGVRLLQYVGDTWVDVTSSVQADRVCGMTTSLSTFAIARQAEEPDPDPDPDPDPTAPVVTNLAVNCTGLVTFDLETSEPVVLDVSIFIPAAAPGYRLDTQITAESGPQHVQFEIPLERSYEWAASVSFGSEWLGDAMVQGCPVQQPNTPVGDDVSVETGGGTIVFDAVDSPGETTVTVLDPSQAPALPAQYQDGPVILLDITSSASFTGSATICFPVDPSFGSLDGARMLHFENGAWVDITSSVDPASRTVCGVATSFSPFAIVRLADDKPGKPEHPGQPGGPDKPGHHPKPPAHHPRPQSAGTSGSTIPTSLPNTGALQPAENGTETVQLMLGALALAAAAGLRISSSRTRGARSR